MFLATACGRNPTPASESEREVWRQLHNLGCQGQQRCDFALSIEPPDRCLITLASPSRRIDGSGYRVTDEPQQVAHLEIAGDNRFCLKGIDTRCDAAAQCAIKVFAFPEETEATASGLGIFTDYGINLCGFNNVEGLVCDD